MNINELLFLSGKWSGEGTAEFPSITTTDYKETLLFEFDYTKDVISYHQKTKYAEQTRSKDTLHLESGFIKQTDDGSIELSNSQNNGRVEVLKLIKLTVDSGKTCALFSSKHIGNDPRMLNTQREYILDGDVLNYEMKMATVDHSDLKTHLKAELKREV